MSYTSQNGGWLACGNDTGVVNIYAGSELTLAKPKPTKQLMNLVTAVDTLKFSADGQALCMASSQAKDAMRVVHLPTCSVFSNWPTSQTPLHRVSCVEFSPSGAFLTIGNDRGKSLLYRVHHYTAI